MEKSLTIKRLFKNWLWVSILLHLLLFLSMITYIVLQPVEEKKPPHYYVPAYVYKGAIKPTLPQPPAKMVAKADKAVKAEKEQPIEQLKNIKLPENIASPNGQLRAERKEKKHEREISHTKSLLSASFQAIQESQLDSLRNNMKNTEPVLLVGDESQTADPLIKMMGRSLSAHFKYPDTEGMMGIKGRVLVQLTLHPEGYYSDVQMVKSSDNQNLDAAALFAVNSAPKVYGVDRFLHKPKRFLVGFVFY